MLRNTEIWLADEQKTDFCGRSLARTLYARPLTILLAGEIGTGKTLFLNGFSSALGIDRHLPSPTFALEHHYVTKDDEPFTHIDLYRLSGDQANAFVEQTAMTEGIRCIEWAQHLTKPPDDPFLIIGIEDRHDRRGRHLTASFQDMPLPDGDRIAEWRADFALPAHIAAHCDAVTACALRLADHLTTRGHIVRFDALEAAARVHDLLRFVDFRPGASHRPEEETEPTVWQQQRERYSGLRHEAACAAFLKEQGYGELAAIVAVHGLRLPPRKHRTIEQQLLYYADKRTKLDTVVPLEERFRDFRERYSGTESAEDGDVWYRQAKELEEELFGGSPPF